MSTPKTDHTEALRALEFIVVKFYRREPALIDMDILDSYGALVRRYSAEENGRGVPDARLAERPARVFAALLEECERILGRTGGAEGKWELLLPVPELLDCLRRLQKSVRTWSGQGGRRGYLDFIGDYVE